VRILAFFIHSSEYGKIIRGSDAVLSLLSDLDEYNRLKNQTQKFIERFADEFAWKNVARKEIEICTQIINKIGSQ